MAVASEYLTLGQGVLSFSNFRPGTRTPAGFLPLGNCPEFNLTVSTETMEHMTSTQKIRREDKSVILSQSIDATITCDDLKPENLARFFLGESSTVSIGALTGQTETFTGVIQGATYQVGISDAAPSGLRQLTSVVVTDNATPTPNTFDIKDDYTLDAARGQITIVEGGAITTGTTLVVAYGTTASTRSHVESGEVQLEGALMFTAYNTSGKDIDYFMPHVRMSPNGDLSLITEDWATIGFEIKGLLMPGRTLLYADGVPVTA